MPILDIDDDYKDVEQKQEARVFRTQEEMKTSTIFHKERQLNDIIQFIRGMKWTVDYFLQIKDINEELNLPDPNLPPTTQKYHRIDKLMLTVQSAITQDNIENVSGEAIVNAGFLPNVYDVFLAELTGGRQALFSITEVQTRTYNLHQAYYITFKLHCFVDTEERIYNDLINKVMKEYVYDKDYLLDYSAPVILQSDYKSKIKLKDAVPELLEYYLLNFVNYEKNVIALPTETNIYVDTLLTNFLFKIINYSDHHLISKLTNLQLDLYKTIPCTIWDAIVNRDVKMLKRANMNLGFKYTPFTLDNIITKKMNALGISYTVGKLDDYSQSVNPPIKDISTPKDESFKLPVDINNRKYVVSSSVYNLTGSYTGTIEELLVDYLNSKIIDTSKLEEPLKNYTSWDTIDQFYLIPILMVLVKDASSQTFKSL